MNTHQEPSNKSWALSQYDAYYNDNVVLPRHVFEEIVDKLLTSHSLAIRERVENAHMAGYHSCCNRDASYSAARCYFDSLALLKDEV